MTVREIGDPRLRELFGDGTANDLGVKPVVRLPRGGPTGSVIAGSALFAALLLFSVLEFRRDAQPVPEVRKRGIHAPVFSPEPPPLYIPPAPPQPQVFKRQVPAPDAAPEPRSVVRPMTAPPPQIFQDSPHLDRSPLPPPVEQPRTLAGPALVIDTTAPPSQREGGGVAAPVAGAGQSLWGGRARAGALANRSTTVAQGTMIPAVLETAFNSTSPGLARAIVSRDVRGFDGEKVLVPRGSRLIGEYQSNVALGQNRALITWTRLIRPDGTTIALASPSTDTLGRGGVRASVNTHFWERFGNALLRTTLDVGTGIAMRAATGPMIVAVPGSANSVQPPQYVPTLSIKAGTSISVFVGRDLEFPDGA